MKKFVFGIIIPVLVGVFLILGAAEMYLRSLPNDFKSKAAYMKQHGREIKILVLGSSGSSMGIKPSCFDMQPSYNCAYANQSIYYNYLILNKYIGDADSLKYVIMDAQYPGLWWLMEDYAATWIKKYVIYYGLEGFKNINDHLEISANLNDIIDRLRHVSDKAACTTCDEDGFQSKYFIEIPYNEQRWKEFGKFHCEEHTNYNRERGDVILRDNVELLKKMILMCKERGVDVVFVSTPCHPYYYNWFNTEQQKVWFQIYDDLSKEYDNVKWFDFTKSVEFSHEDMSNICHLNTKGAIKFTRMLNDTINDFKNKLEKQ